MSSSKTISTLKAIERSILDTDTKFAVKITPDAFTAAQGNYTAIESPGVILIYAGGSSSYIHPKLFEDDTNSPHRLSKSMTIAVTVGFKTFTNSDLLIVLTSDLEALISYRSLSADAYTLFPSSISEPFKDESGIYWQQLLFETNISEMI